MQIAPEPLVRRATAFVRERPVAVVAALAAVALVAAVAYLLWRYRRPAGRRLLSLLADRDAVTVLMHPNPDPDAMAAAMGVAELAEQVGVTAKLRYSGAVRHQENRVFRTVLDVEMEEIERADELDPPVILVDHNQVRGFDGVDGLRPFGVVDHHPGEGKGESFTDVRTDYGATASVVAEYFRDIGARPIRPDEHESEVDAEFVLSSSVATGLLYGILTDTDDLTRGVTSHDFAAASFLCAGVDEDLLDRIANPQVSAEVLETKARAIAGREVRGSFAVSDVGTISNADVLSQAANELVELEGVTAVVVCGEVDGTVHLSGRSRDDRVHMGRVIDEAIRNWPQGDGGGHARMGGGHIPPSGSAEADADADGGTVARTRVDRSVLVERLFDSLGGAT